MVEVTETLFLKYVTGRNVTDELVWYNSVMQISVLTTGPLHLVGVKGKLLFYFNVQSKRCKRRGVAHWENNSGQVCDVIAQKITKELLQYNSDM